MNDRDFAAEEKEQGLNNDEIKNSFENILNRYKQLEIENAWYKDKFKRIKEVLMK